MHLLLEADAHPGSPRLDSDEVARFGHDGYLAVRRPLASSAEVSVVRDMLAALFADFDRLPSELAYDLGEVKLHEGRQQIPEINLPTQFEPRLLETVVFARCLDLARQLLGATTYCTYDHAILKPPHNRLETVWHQDLATAPQLADQRAVHMWVPLQDVDEDNGCMRFIPRAGRRELMPHRRRTATAHALMVDDVSSSQAVSCPLRAGMVTVHDLYTLHSTGPNTTAEPRLAWILHFHDRPRPRTITRVTRTLRQLRR